MCVPRLAPLNVSLGQSIATDPIESNSVSQGRRQTNAKGVGFPKTVFSVVHCASAFNQCVSIQPCKLGLVLFVCFYYTYRNITLHVALHALWLLALLQDSAINTNICTLEKILTAMIYISFMSTNLPSHQYDKFSRKSSNGSNNLLQKQGQKQSV